MEYDNIWKHDFAYPSYLCLDKKIQGSCLIWFYWNQIFKRFVIWYILFHWRSPSSSYLKIFSTWIEPHNWYLNVTTFPKSLPNHDWKKKKNVYTITFLSTRLQESTTLQSHNKQTQAITLHHYTTWLLQSP